MTYGKAYEKFRLTTGLSDEEVNKWLPLLKEAEVYVGSLVVKKDLTESEKIRLENAAAVYAYYLYVSYSSVEHRSFSAGDISVTYNPDIVKNAENMWKRELISIGDIANSGFIFRRVT